ncbi:MAG: hypothetical protein A2504_10385 [Bdellovibrionales bacterium RIFOXYD12_FULL_39_22]|nr:MAG: hypothetical protein A2385_17000 [Bdellovibrionales bacterium RIFOXYB1_FULL_39_21]OFZ44113.1 MAG: hypothetical protein A2485_14240 [Bdellovibrionales bacterium RIFOXYC12_FULL_39_17]OFZ48653.1 MAG: hypothetical protein A2404_08205 [Bdellovibrionales bacterium RIFOXYC1_FULL_39_130]OFZ76767.1 MAG: hypothetical protein A2560_10495 [Bdellovibrionales bacterium RIFOXYD1_FULL_39_84]OFZ95070.1 MAG: hypothetical protein A2504_10385 [Bdellovibrionales bacterium RIFOXYD12_FULL_39_22]
MMSIGWSRMLLVRGLLFVACFSYSISMAVEKKVDDAQIKSRFETLELFNKVLHTIETQYYREVDTDKLIQGALKGMMDTLDPHSAFLDKNVFEKMQEDTKGEFGGLGIEVTQRDGVIVIITPIEDSPAFNAGLLPGDKIIEINHENVVGISLEKAIDMMKGDKKSKVNLGIVREGSDVTKYFTIKREIIKTKAIKTQLLGDNIIYLRLSQFQQRAGQEVEDAIKKHYAELGKSKKTPRGVVLDLRFNPGGLLEEAVNVASIFLKDGIVVSTEGRNKNEKEFRYVKKDLYKELKLPLAVLINGASASASEIVAGAIQDAKRGLIMGTRSFGKGSVQQVSKIDDEKGLKLTIAQYMTPNGKKIQAIGIRPDVELGEIDSSWLNKHYKNTNFLREKDLRNHLTATKETAEEKVVREEMEKEERIARAESLEESKRKKSEQDSEEKDQIFKKYEPAEDYQVVQAVNYLQSFDLFLEIKLPANK